MTYPSRLPDVALNTENHTLIVDGVVLTVTAESEDMRRDDSRAVFDSICNLKSEVLTLRLAIAHMRRLRDELDRALQTQETPMQRNTAVLTTLHNDERK
jgi:hypothetical protein